MFNKWINKPKKIREHEDMIEITAYGKTDFFIDPTSDFKANNAPIYVTEANKDFTISCQVTPHFVNYYDAGAIMLYISDTNWVKFAFEYTDMDHKAVVSVVTDQFSDDSNGEKINDKSIWMKMTKKEDAIGLYYSIDMENWKMVRLFKHIFNKNNKVYIGLEAQSPQGNECKVVFKNVTLSEKSVKDLRKGV